jgi:hypothetical protein
LDEIMCDKEQLVSYLYDDLPDAERAGFDRHLRDCENCRVELNALRGVRADLISWSPPQPQFGFRVVQEPKVLPMRPPAASWRAWWTPAAGLAAAAVLVLAAASAIARIEVRSGPDGFTVRTGWSASAPATEQRYGETASRSASASGPERSYGGPPSASQSSRGDVVLSSSPAGGGAASAGAVDGSMTGAVDGSTIEALDRRLRALEALSREPGLVRNASYARASASDADVIRRVREMLAQSETKQQGQLAVRIAQVIRDFEAQRVADLTRIQQGLRGIERTVTEEAQGHREAINYLLTSSKQK